jgi:propanol-preferring alcohol dehydrogenase
MRAALLHEFGKALAVGEVPRPEPLPDEVLIRVEACGVCHSDLHLAHGDWPDVAAKMTLPAILGHEAVGRVVEKGATARSVEVGERVGVGWLCRTCGECEHCRDAAENVCLKRQVTGIAIPGGYAELLRVPASHAIRVPDGLDPIATAPLFCAGLTVYRACKNAGLWLGSESRGSAQSKRVAIFGVGGLGHLALQLARHASAEVIAVDIRDEKLDFARSLGAHRTVKASDPTAARQLRADGGPHIAVVTAPSKPAYDLAFRTLRKRGTLAVVGLPKEDLTFFADDLVVGEFRILGTAVGTRDDQRDVLALAAAGKLRCEVEACRLEHINDVYARMMRGEILGRAVLDLR